MRPSSQFLVATRYVDHLAESVSEENRVLAAWMDGLSLALSDPDLAREMLGALPLRATQMGDQVYARLRDELQEERGR